MILINRFVLDLFKTKFKQTINIQKSINIIGLTNSLTHMIYTSSLESSWVINWIENDNLWKSIKSLKWFLFNFRRKILQVPTEYKDDCSYGDLWSQLRLNKNNTRLPLISRNTRREILWFFLWNIKITK